MALDNFVLQNTNPLEAYFQGAGGIQTLQNNQQVMQVRQQQMDQLQAAQQLAQQQAEAAQAAAIAKQQAQVDMYNTDNPYERAKKIALYTARFPEEVAAIKQSTQGMSDAQRTSLLGLAGKITSATDNGRLDLGKQEFANQIAAMKTGGAPPEQIAAVESYQHMYDYDPKGAILGLGVAANAIDPATFEANIKAAAETQGIKGKESREVEMQPLEVANKKASTKLTQAQTYASGAGVLNDLARMKLDKLKELRESNGVQLSDAAMKIQGAYIDNATTARSSAGTAESLANSYLTLDPNSAAAGAGSELFKRLSGSSDEISNLRKNYTMFKNQGALTMLPPGAASENDMVRVLEGFPDVNTNPRAMAQYLSSYAKVQKDAATANELKAEWISANGNLGRTTKDITMGETTVPAGTTFSRFLPLAMKNAAKTSAVASAGADPTARYAKYGR